MKVLWLCSWYPNKLKPFDGDFIQRHAQAVSSLHHVYVIFIKKDEDGIITKEVKEETQTHNNLTETIVYYRPLKTGISFFDKVISNRKFKKLYKEVIGKYISVNGKPALVHVHVALKAGMLAVWLKKKFGIPYIVSEHWTGYMPDARPNFYDQNLVYRNWAQEIFSGAAKVTVVSKALSHALQSFFNVERVVIPNVVNTDIFFPVQKQGHSVARFIHVSTNTYQKNVEQILQAFAEAKNKGYDFELIFYVPDTKKLQLQINDRNLDTEAIVHQEVPQDILAEDLRVCDALVLYSHYETFGCVVIEANASGVPAILSDLPVFREYSLENKTAIFALPNDPTALSEAIISFIENRNNFNPTEIAEYTKSKFQYEVVAKQFDELYNQITRRN